MFDVCRRDGSESCHSARQWLWGRHQVQLVRLGQQGMIVVRNIVIKLGTNTGILPELTIVRKEAQRDPRVQQRPQEHAGPHHCQEIHLVAIHEGGARC